MRTIVLNQPQILSMINTPEPFPTPPGEALVRVRRTGVCGTDYHAFRGTQPFFNYPRILGHELGVEIVEIPENPHGLKPGDCCAVEPYLNCGICIACTKGKTNCCTQLKVLGVHTDGGMREIITVPINKLHKSDKLTLEQLALVETIGIGAHAVSRAQVEKGEYALVVGAGPIGLSTVAMAKRAGAKIIVVDVNENRLEFCSKSLRVRHCIKVGDHLESHLLDITSGDMPTLIFDCTGNPASMTSAFNLISHGGRIVFVGLFLGDITFNDPNFHKREITLLASRNSTSTDMKRVIDYLEKGMIDSGSWITHQADASEMIENFQRWLNPEEGVIKAMIHWD